MLLRKSLPLFLIFFAVHSPFAGELKTPSEVPSMSGLPIDVTSVHDAVIQDPELTGLRVMAIFIREYAHTKVPCSDLTGPQLISDFKQRVKYETAITHHRPFDELSVDEQNRAVARTIASEWTLTKGDAGKKERLLRMGRNPAQCL